MIIAVTVVASMSRVESTPPAVTPPALFLSALPLVGTSPSQKLKTLSLPKQNSKYLTSFLYDSAATTTQERKYET